MLAVATSYRGNFLCDDTNFESGTCYTEPDVLHDRAIPYMSHYPNFLDVCASSQNIFTYAQTAHFSRSEGKPIGSSFMTRSTNKDRK